MGARRANETNVFKKPHPIDRFHGDDAHALHLALDNGRPNVLGGFRIGREVELVAKRQVTLPLFVAPKVGRTGFRFDDDGLVPVMDRDEVRADLLVSSDRDFAVFLHAHRRKGALPHDRVRLVGEIGSEVAAHHEHALLLGERWFSCGGRLGRRSFPWRHAVSS